MRIVLNYSVLVCICLLLGCNSSPSADDSSAGRLVNGKRISVARQLQAVGSLPMNMVLTADGRFVLSTDMGYRQSLWAIRTDTGVGAGDVEFSNESERMAHATGEAAADPVEPGTPLSDGLYYGLAAAADGTIFAAQGGHDSIAVLMLDADGKLTPEREISTRRFDFPAGLALDGRGFLFVANNTAGGNDPRRSPGSIAIYNADTGQDVGRCELPNRFHGTSGFPLAICVLRDGSKAYVASERDGAVYVIDASEPSHPTVHANIATGAEPVGMTLSADQHRLFVANAQSDNVTVIDTAGDQPLATILLRPEQARGLRGATPVSLALSPDQNTLYVAMADMNAIAVVDVSHVQSSVLLGYLPTGWYPSAIVAAPDGKRLFVADARGSAAVNPNNHLPSTRPGQQRSYILNLLEGDVRTIMLPDSNGLKAATAQVLAQNSLPAPVRDSDEHVAEMGVKSHRIQHVFYVIKENRTYDQVLGDLPQGNGDASLTLFGRNITPNLHALAERFVLLDNIYCCGEVSGDGWCWSTEGMANAYVSRNVPYQYSKRGRKFDFEGQNNGLPTGGFPTTGPDRPATTNPLLSQGGEELPDVGSAGDHLWDAAQRAGVSCRNYGFFLYFADNNAGVPGGPDNYPAVIGLRPGGHDLDGVSDLDFRRFDLDYADSDAPRQLFEKTGNASSLYGTRTYGAAAAPSRFAEWKREFDLMLRKDPTGRAVPALNLLRIGNDHTQGMKAGAHSPRSMVADNDYAVGQLVDAISHSPIWTSSAIFVIEDDAQSGEDHVDAHRTTCYVISPWIKPASVDHRFYNTDSVLKTQELLLGIAPMTQFESIAAAIDDWDSTPDNIVPYNAIFPDAKLISEVNPQPRTLSETDPRRRLIELSDQMDFRRADAAPTDLLNEVVWKSVRGLRSDAPPVRVSNSLPTAKDDDGDGDDDDK